jgi:hypothetical protein
MSYQDNDVYESQTNSQIPMSGITEYFQRNVKILKDSKNSTELLHVCPNAKVEKGEIEGLAFLHFCNALR